MIKKAIIPVAGLASRFLPASKVIPKTMFPINGKPIIQILVEEAVAAGIEEVAIVIGPRQEIIKKHFESDEYLEMELKNRGKNNEAEIIKKISELANIQFFVQDNPLGDGHALLSTKNFLNENEPCLVLFGDELIGEYKSQNAAQYLISYYNKVKTPIIGVKTVDQKDVSKYGIVKINNKNEVLSLIEKPNAKEAPSNLGIIGKYIINKKLLKSIKSSSSGTQDGELRLIDGFKTYKETEKIHVYTLDGPRFDTGNKLGLIMANVHFGLKDQPIKEDLTKFLNNIEPLKN